MHLLGKKAVLLGVYKLHILAVGDYRIAGKFGGDKVWRIWRITSYSPN